MPKLNIASAAWPGTSPVTPRVMRQPAGGGRGHASPNAGGVGQAFQPVARQTGKSVPQTGKSVPQGTRQPRTCSWVTQWSRRARTSAGRSLTVAVRIPGTESHTVIQPWGTRGADEFVSHLPHAGSFWWHFKPEISDPTVLHASAGRPTITQVCLFASSGGWSGELHDRIVEWQGQVRHCRPGLCLYVYSPPCLFSWVFL